MNAITPTRSPDDNTSTTSQQHHTTNEPQSLTVHGFVKAVDKFSKLPGGYGAHHTRLARFFSSILAAESNGFQAPKLRQDFLTIYSFERTVVDQPLQTGPDRRSPKIAVPRAKWQLRPPLHLESCHALEQYEIQYQRDSPGQLCFMRGYPSPEWLGLIGAKYLVDPEFFNIFLDVRTGDDRTNDFSMPSLPAQSWNILQLSLTTIGLRNTLGSYGQRTDLTTMRSAVDTALTQNHHHILRGGVLPVGSSIIRAVNVLDQMHFTIEQNITICLQPPELKRGWTILIWMDAGSATEVASLSTPLCGALRVQTPIEGSLLPIIEYKPMMGLKASSISKRRAATGDPSHQSGTVLHLDYGHSLRANHMAVDPFYALFEIFTLIAASERQFLNLIEQKLHSMNLDVELDDLRYLDKLLYKHTRRIKDTISAINQTNHPKWPKLQDDTTKRAREDIESDFENLKEQADAMSKRCQEEITVLMNTIVILEAEKAMRQTERVRKLTFLAFIFAPLSFTTSFFGMNVKSLVVTSIWPWIVMTASTCLVTIAFLYGDVSKIRHFLRKKFSHPVL